MAKNRAWVPAVASAAFLLLGLAACGDSDDKIVEKMPCGTLRSNEVIKGEAEYKRCLADKAFYREKRTEQNRLLANHFVTYHNQHLREFLPNPRLRDYRPIETLEGLDDHRIGFVTQYDKNFDDLIGAGFVIEGQIVLENDNKGDMTGIRMIAASRKKGEFGLPLGLKGMNAYQKEALEIACMQNSWLGETETGLCIGKVYIGLRFAQNRLEKRLDLEFEGAEFLSADEVSFFEHKEIMDKLGDKRSAEIEAERKAREGK